MNHLDYVKEEIEKACKRENPNWNGKDFDYGCSCYQSAFKAYKSLYDDEHSGFSWSVTSSILKRLLDDRPIFPITEEDKDFTNIRGPEDATNEVQYTRMSSLFRTTNPDGTFSYHDVERVYCYDMRKKMSWGGPLCRYIEKNYLKPITLPYAGEKWQINIIEFDDCYYVSKVFNKQTGEVIFIEKFIKENEETKELEEVT